MKGSIKNKLYDLLVTNNLNIKQEYEQNIIMNPQKHANNRFFSWIHLLKLNVKYRIFRRSPNIAVDTQAESDKVQEPPKQVAASLKNPQVHLGAESQINPPPLPEHMIKELLKYDVISFDIFDTLLFRPVARPKDIFVLLGDKHEIFDFESIRIRSEREARNIHINEYGNDEVTLLDIYKRVEFYTGITAEYGMDLEVALESKLLFSNPYMKRVFDMLRVSGKRIVAVSDMYLPKEILENILSKNGYHGFEEIYVSCDCGVSKKEGDLYGYVQKAIGNPNTVIHIDDSWQAVVNARENNWTAIHYKNVNAVGLCHRAKNMSPIIGAAYAGVTNAYLYNGLYRQSPIYEFGFTYGGLFALGYCNWIHDFCIKNNVDKILFLARDGHILKQIYEKQFSDISTTYLYYSRIAAARISIDSWPYLYLDSFVLKKVKTEEMSIIAYLKLLEISELEPCLAEYDLEPLDIVTEKEKRVLNNFLKFLVDYRGKIKEIYDKEVKGAKTYFEDEIGDAKKVVVVDIGWRGSSALSLRKFLQKECNTNCEVIGLMAASPYEVNMMEIQTEKMFSYLFSPSHNYNALEKHDRFGVDNAIYEFFLSAEHSTLKNFMLDKHGKEDFVFEEPDVENYPIIHEIQQGMLDFAEEYLRHWGDTEFMLRIPGNDVAVNIQHLIVHKEYFKRYFQDFKFNMGIAGKTVPFPQILK